MFYYLTYRDKIENLEGYIFKSFYNWEIREWTSSFPEIAVLWRAHIWDNL